MVDNQIEPSLAALLRHSAPPELRVRVMSAVQQEVSTPPVFLIFYRRFVPVLASFILGIALTFYVQTMPATDHMADEVVANHVRSLMPGHLTDVVSSDQHTVKPWFNGKIDFGPTVKDFATQGFTLLGGRLDYLDHHTVAALSYQHAKHIINVFIAPDSGDDTPSKSINQRGYNLIYARKNHMAYWLVSDLNIQDLQILAMLVVQ